MYPSGLDRLVEAVELAERKSAAASNKKGFVCPVATCGRIFSKRFNLQAHGRLHDGSRPFACTLCAKKFMWKSSLKSHAKMHAKHASGISKQNTHRKQITTDATTKKKHSVNSLLTTSLPIPIPIPILPAQQEAQLQQAAVSLEPKVAPTTAATT